jgi:hypothetical protein
MHMEIVKEVQSYALFISANTVHTNVTYKHTEFMCCVCVGCITSDRLTQWDDIAQIPFFVIYV